MKGCFAAIAVVVCGALGGAVALSLDPQLPGEAVSVGASGVGWITGALSRLGENPIPSPTAPGDGPIPMPGTPAAPAPSVPANTVPIVPITPSPALTPTAPWKLPWTTQDRVWAVTTLQWDARLDTQAETTYPGERAYYAMWVGDWLSCLTDITSFEGGYPASPAVRSGPPAWFALAITYHRADTLSHPGDAGWNNLWIQAYERLELLWSDL